MRFRAKNIAPGILAILFATISSVQAEVMLQFFNMSWQEIIDKMPEIAENGYTSLWLPPPQKASGDLSVGYDLWDPFDIGGHPQRTGGRTRYGTEEEMLRLIETAHRHGLRVYFDNIMNHRAFDIPGYNENTPIDLYPGMLPEDFHLRVTEEGFYRPWGNTVNWGSTWEVQNQYLSGLIDIAHETPNSNFGPALGYTHPKIEFVRHPDNPEFYDFHPTEGHVGFGSPLITTNVIAENSGFYKEDVGSYLMRSIRWLVDYTKLDGLRLDAVKHVPAYFFGKQSGDDKDGSSDGYIGQAQWQYNMTRGLSDWNNHRDSNFNILQPRDDLLVFGEHMGEPPGYGEFFESGMRLLDAKTHSTLNNLAWIDLNILQTSDYVPNMQFGKNLGIYYAKSHDDNIAYGEHLHYALNLTREGIGNIYTDGNRQAPTLGESGGAFPRHANTKPFGQFGDTRVPNLVNIHNNLARGGQYGAWADNDVVSYTRRDFSENDSMTDGDATTLHFMLNRNWDFGAYREIPTPFPEGSILWQYADGGGNFYHQVTDGKIKVTVPPAGYFAFSWRSPEESRLWQWGGGKPITLLSDGLPAGTMTYERWDGPDGDPNFNPYGLPNRGYPEGSEPEEFRYRYTIPRVTSASNLAFYAHVDGSANNVMFKLNGGVPLNSLAHEGGDPRDNPPAISYDMVLGYEQADFHARIWPEKFGSRNADLNQIGSASAETYEFVVGESGFTFWAPDNAANNYTDATGPVFVYHNPEINTDDGRPQITPAPESAVNQPISFEVKTGNQGDTDRVFVYYTTDGSWPNGAGGFGVGNTRVVELLFRTNIIEGSSSPVTREDVASNYITGWSNNGNGGNGFTAWNLYGTNANAGHFIWSSTEYGHADINSSDVAFGMYGYSNQYANAERGISSWGDNNTFSIDLATQWRDGNRGISLFNSSSTFNETSQIWNFNISTNGYADTGFPYFGDIKLNLLVRQNGANLDIVVTGSSVIGNWSDTWSTTIFNQSLGGFRLYTGGDHDSDGERNLYFNNLVLTAPPTLDGDVNDWWAFGQIPPQPAGTRIKYKISGLRQQGYNGREDWEVLFPNSWDALERKLSRMATWKIENFNPSTVVYRPHNDYGLYRTGLVEGFNFIAARAFLQRDGAAEGNGQRAAIYNSFYQPFYFDAAPPAGEVRFPEENDTLFDNRYGVVVRTDSTVTKVWYNIIDSDASNDDAATGARQGNGLGTNGTAWVEAQRVNPSINIDSPYPFEWRFNFVNIPASGTATIRLKLAEYSSATNPALSDAEGHFTTVERTINARGPEFRMNVAWPQKDGDTVGEGYVMKVEFSRALWDNSDEATVRSRFLITLNGLPQDRNAYQLYWRGEGNHELAFTLPDLFNSDPNYEHTILVTHTNAAGSGINLTAERRVRVPFGAPPPAAQIINPPEFNLDGAPYQIILPDVATPDPSDRQHEISVQTVNSADNVWITFKNSSGSASAVPSAVNNLSGTISVTTNSTVLVGDTNTLFQEEIAAGGVLQIAGQRYVVSLVPSNDYLKLTSPYLGATATGITAQRVTGNPTAVGDKLMWQFTWSNLTAGTYTIVANMDSDNNPATIEATTERTTRVLLRQQVEEDPVDLDDDDDGLYDEWETIPEPLPETNPESWNNGDVHVWNIYGRSDPRMPDTDGDGLPDGLELGWGGALDQTDTSADTNGDGWPNFIGDTDPPYYNTVPDNSAHPRYNFNASRTDQLSGSITDPNRADTDSDQLNDGVEDANRNGRVEVGIINGEGVITSLLTGWNLPMVYNSSRVDRDGLPANARILETDPNSNDTIGDGMSDGAADVNANGRVDMMVMQQNGSTENFDISSPGNHHYLLGMDDASQSALAAAGHNNVASRAINYSKLFTDYGRPVIGGDGNWYETNKWPRILFHETDPLTRDTDGDGLDDGWEVRYGIDPFDDGWYNLRTGVMHLTNSQQGADGDLTGDGISNGQHQSAGTDPRVDVNIPVPAGSINIGPGPVIGQINGIDIREEFMDWTWDDLRALDYYDGDGPNSDQTDIYPGFTADGNDGFDTSRDLVAFYSRDGGAAGAGGDDKFYFRLDFYDLQAFAEEGFMDAYIVIDTGNTGDGERVLPDQVDTLTDMRWELVVALYNSTSGRVFVDYGAQHTSTFTEDLFSFGGVVGRDDYFLGAHFNSALDAVEFAISRQALLDVGYIGDPTKLNFQVFTVKSGTQNSPQGAGDLGGRSDIRDSIYNDYIAEFDYYAQAGLQGVGSVLRAWIPGGNRPNRAKFSKIVHGNQAIQPGDVIQDLINNDAGAGYYRPVDAHDALGMPFNLHVTPTLASAMQWASSDTKAWRDGPAFNARIGELARNGELALMASTFSDHMMPYFTPDFVADNIALADEVLETIYGVDLTADSVFWTPERLLDADVFAKISTAGYRSTVLDQMEHLQQWFGRNAALGNRGYQINRIDGINTFAINNGANDFRFANHDRGLNMPLRRLFIRKARGDRDQVVILMSDWGDFTSKSLADAYDVNLIWMANRPWIHGVTLESILKNEVDLDGDGWGNSWYVQERSSPGNNKRAHNYVNYMTRLNYDNWYLGSSLEDGLLDKVFNIRPGVPVPNEYGMLYSGGVVSQAWNAVRGVSNGGLDKLARGALHASVFQTAFHNGNLGDMSKFSDGTYITPDSANKTLANFASIAQAHTRHAAIYARVNQWLASAASLTNARTEQADVDLDDENEYLLYNKRVFGVFERSGGRMIAGWVREPGTGTAYQMIGNQMNWAGAETEEEGTSNETAFRTSAFKDWFASSAGRGYVNDLYDFTSVAGGWRIAKGTDITKTITLGDDNAWFTANYQVAGGLGTLFVRNGLSPDLYGLLIHGQQFLSPEQVDGGIVTLAQTYTNRTIATKLAYGTAAGHSASFNGSAVDGTGLDTRRMRKQAQTHQVEVSGSGTFSFSIGFEVSGEGEQFNNGVPHSWLSNNGYNPETVDVNSEMAANSVNTLYQAYIADLDPRNANAMFEAQDTHMQAGSIIIRFNTSSEREYMIWYNDNGLVSPTWFQGPTNRIQGTGSVYEWEDDGTETDPAPAEVDQRFYKIEVTVPES